jgi:hypothetical protein
MQRSKQRFGLGGRERGSIGSAELHDVRHHVNVVLVQVPPDPSMVGSDINGDLPFAHLDPPAS